MTAPRRPLQPEWTDWYGCLHAAMQARLRPLVRDVNAPNGPELLVRRDTGRRWLSGLLRWVGVGR